MSADLHKTKGMRKAAQTRARKLHELLAAAWALGGHEALAQLMVARGLTLVRCPTMCRYSVGRPKPKPPWSDEACRVCRAFGAVKLTKLGPSTGRPTSSLGARPSPAPQYQLVPTNRLTLPRGITRDD